MSTPHPSAPTRAGLCGVFAALMALLGLTAAATWLPPGPWSLPIALVIASAKIALIFLYFMRLRYQRGMVRIFAVAGFFWLAAAGVLMFADYLTRAWML